MSGGNQYNIFLSAMAKPTRGLAGKDARTATRPEDGREAFRQTIGAFMSTSEQIKAHNAEKRRTLAQVAEILRADSEQRRNELLALWLQKEEEKPYDVFGKCLDIARRIIRGEKVTAEEMRLLSQNFPELLFQALLLRQMTNDDDEQEFESLPGEGAKERNELQAVFFPSMRQWGTPII